jgi:uncharacterized protein YlzI (FlbEa/FlbD family)
MIQTLIALQLITLHAIDGREIEINPHQITSLHAAKEGEPNKVLHTKVFCLINLTDGKFVSVAETCETVRQLLENAR